MLSYSRSDQVDRTNQICVYSTWVYITKKNDLLSFRLRLILYRVTIIRFAKIWIKLNYFLKLTCRNWTIDLQNYQLISWLFFNVYEILAMLTTKSVLIKCGICFGRRLIANYLQCDELCLHISCQLYKQRFKKNCLCYVFTTCPEKILTFKTIIIFIHCVSIPQIANCTVMSWTYSII